MSELYMVVTDTGVRAADGAQKGLTKQSADQQCAAANTRAAQLMISTRYKVAEFTPPQD